MDWYPLYCTNCWGKTEHTIEQETGSLWCMRCGLRFGANRRIMRRHIKNKPKPKDYKGHEAEMREGLEQKPRPHIEIIPKYR